MSRGRAPTGRHRFGILIPTLTGGGAERKALAIASGLIRRGHEVDLVLERLVCDYPEEVPPESRLFYLRLPGKDARSHTGREPLPVAPELPCRGPYPFRVRYPRLSLATALSWSQLPMLTSGRLPRWAAMIAAYLDRERPDALLAMLIPSVAAATMAARAARHRVRVVGTLHNAVRARRWLPRARRSYPRLDAAVGVSRGVAAELTEAVGVPADRVHTIYNPVVSEGFVRDARQPAGHPWLDEPGPQVVLAAGRLQAEGFLDPPRGVRQASRPPAARLIVLGKGRRRAMLTSQAEELRIAPHVDFPGFVQNPYAFMAKASLFVLSSQYEGLPTVLIEAMACGCPVVSTDCRFGPDEILEDGRWGELVPVGDAKALSEAMLRALDRPPSSDALRKRASVFGIDRAVTRYEALLLGGGR